MSEARTAADWLANQKQRIVASFALGGRRSKPLAIDTEICKLRHLIESLVSKLKEFKRIALRA